MSEEHSTSKAETQSPFEILALQAEAERILEASKKILDVSQRRRLEVQVERLKEELLQRLEKSENERLALKQELEKERAGRAS